MRIGSRNISWQLLGMDRYTLDGFLKQRGVWLEYSADELQREVETGERLWQKKQDEVMGSGQSDRG